MAKKKKHAAPRREQETQLGISELARRLGRNHGVVSRWVQRPDWRWGKGPWRKAEVEEIAAWAKGLQENRAGDEEKELAGRVGKAMAAAKYSLIKERTAMIKLMREIKEKEYVLRQAHEEEKAKQWAAVKKALMQLPRALRQILADTVDPGKCEDILVNALRVVCNEGFEGQGLKGLKDKDQDAAVGNSAGLSD